ncbi:MAG: 3-phosphoshikimate 1-carboxyvinyltransferase [Oligoflexales bacterium]|nr:3-phosphoshikimate 1-carboxyvinyltransferase [Oligoflexales bacterium]
MLDSKLLRTITIDIPPDKSLSHRFLIFAALAKGKSDLKSLLKGADCISTLNCLKSLGVQYTKINLEHAAYFDVKADSPGFQDWNKGPLDLDFGNSGTSARLLIALLAALPGLNATCYGDPSLIERPMARVIDPLLSMGADIRYLAKPGYLPIEIKGKQLQTHNFEINIASAQIKSALILASLVTSQTDTKKPQNSLQIKLPKGSRDHTENILRGLGFPIINEIQNSKELISLALDAQQFLPIHTKIPADPSSAAFFVPLALHRSGRDIFFPELLLNQGRCAYLQKFRQFGFEIEMTAQAELSAFELAGSVRVKSPENIRPIQVKASEVASLIDEIPILAITALFANGVSTFAGLEELRYKESDRLELITRLINAAGGRATIEKNDLRVEPNARNLYSLNKSFDCAGDHRIVMCASILRVLSGDPIAFVDDPSVAVSFPNFFELLKKHFA